MESVNEKKTTEVASEVAKDADTQTKRAPPAQESPKGSQDRASRDKATSPKDAESKR